MAWLLDTNVLSVLRRPKPEPRVVDFVAGCPLDQLYISAVPLVEIRFGIELVGDPHRRAELNDWLTNKVHPIFNQWVLKITPRDRSDYDQVGAPVINSRDAS